MAFDLDAFRAAHRPWSVRLHGHTFTARWLSADEVLGYHVLWEPGPVRGDAEPKEEFAERLREYRAQVLSAGSRLLRACFPWRPVMLLYGDPVAVFRRANDVEQQAWLYDFFASRAAIIAARRPTTPSTA